MLLTRHVVAAIAALATCIAAASADGQPQAQALVVTCTNPASGTTWQISIDYDRATVDANPARVSAAEISWHDAKDGGNYTLDRGSGDLTVVRGVQHRRLFPAPSLRAAALNLERARRAG